jgi:hypothetical protein
LKLLKIFKEKILELITFLKDVVLNKKENEQNKPESVAAQTLPPPGQVIEPPTTTEPEPAVEIPLAKEPEVVVVKPPTTIVVKTQARLVLINSMRKILTIL